MQMSSESLEMCFPRENEMGNKKHFSSYFFFHLIIQKKCCQDPAPSS